jgi:hypothetical protein
MALVLEELKVRAEPVEPEAAVSMLPVRLVSVLIAKDGVGVARQAVVGIMAVVQGSTAAVADPLTSVE